MAERVLASLVRLHENGLVHGDVSADNVFVTNDGALRLLDYGRARPRGELEPQVDVHAVGMLIARMLGGEPEVVGDRLPPRVHCLLDSAMEGAAGGGFEDAAAMHRVVAVLSDDVSHLSLD